MRPAVTAHPMFCLKMRMYLSSSAWTEADNILFMKTVAEITTNPHQQLHLQQAPVVFSETRTHNLSPVVCLAALEVGIHSSNLPDPICSQV